MPTPQFSFQHLHAFEDLQYEVKRMQVTRKKENSLAGFIIGFFTFVVAACGLVSVHTNDKQKDKVLYTLVCIGVLFLAVVIIVHTTTRLKKLNIEKKELEKAMNDVVDRRDMRSVNV